MRPFLPSLRSLAVLVALLAGCRDAAPLQRVAPDAPQFALILTGISDLGTMGGDVVTE